MATVIESEIVQGLRNGEFILYYQPKASLVTNRIVGAEALARWRRPDALEVPPGVFIPLAERSSLIRQLTLQLLDRLLEDVAGNGLGQGLSVSLNVSARDLEDATLTRTILHALAHRRLATTVLELEITETQALQGGERMLSNVQALAEAGIGLAMDDYGIGYSTMDTLSQWPFTTIKLDQGIVGRMLNSPKNATIVRSSIRLGHELGLSVVAEGVESPEQHDFLVESGCRVAQGYLISRPLPFNEFDVFRHNIGKCHGMPIGLVYMAILDHIQWRRQMVSYAIQRTALPKDSPVRQLDGFPALCLTQCALGKWYNGEGRYFADNPMYQAIDAPHRALHDVGARIVEAVRAGAGLRDMAPLLGGLKQASTRLVCLLEDLEDAGLEALYTAPEPDCPAASQASLG
ncbi:EAL domain-containing protein [Massilia sp. GCM10020059]|uniref:EAL domain-containing protein n=1 Tax=Massilia agrisoli TaxID=2892444 RepID=A0ABS8IRF8_9BURK|nr:EAL domain-containing protein [Massilia agrisoli]MCC6070333.1 EAL domain-containing protein [Massilia agrisoli]